MKYKLETIPVWDALKERDSCLLCTLMEKAEQRYIAYYLGSSVMNPETRVEVNRTGFCAHHAHALIASGKQPQAMGLIAHTHLSETKETIAKSLNVLQKSEKVKQLKAAALALSEGLAERRAGCLICSSKRDTLKRYAFTFVHLIGNDREFKDAYLSSNGLCLDHLPKVFALVPDALKKREQQTAFYRFMGEDLENRFSTMIDEVGWMTQMYKSENLGKDWRGCQDAHKRAVRWEYGAQSWEERS